MFENVADKITLSSHKDSAIWKREIMLRLWSAIVGSMVNNHATSLTSGYFVSNHSSYFGINFYKVASSF